MVTKKFVAKVGALLGAASLAFALAGCASENGSSSDATGGTHETQSDAAAVDESASSTDEADVVEEDQDETSVPSPGKEHADFAVTAGRLAEKQVPGSKVVEMDLENGGANWEVEVQDSEGERFELEVSFDGTAVLRGPVAENEDERDRTENRAHLQAATIDFESVIQILAREFPDATLDELELDEENGQIVWEVELNQDARQFDVDVDVKTGDILRVGD